MSARGKDVVVAGDCGPLIAGQVHASRQVHAVADVPGRKVTRAFRSPHYDRLWRRKRITDAQREAADLYARLHELGEQGARDDAGQHAGRVDGASPWAKDGLTVARVAALGKLQAARAVVGVHARQVLDAVIIADLSPVAYADYVRLMPEVSAAVREYVALGLLIAALERLVEHWRMSA